MIDVTKEPPLSLEECEDMRLLINKARNEPNEFTNADEHKLRRLVRKADEPNVWEEPRDALISLAILVFGLAMVWYILDARSRK